MDAEVLLKTLNPPQREAATTLDGPLLVVAGAGSGKTKMLTTRISLLIHEGKARPHEILAVTFTNKAAREMKERVFKQMMELGRTANPEIGTFHSICLKILRNELQATPYQKAFSIYDDGDQLSLIKEVYKRNGIDDKAFSPKGVQSAINRLKCDAIEPQDLEPPAHELFQKVIKKVYGEYQKLLFENQAIDFGEILCLTYRVLRDHPEVRSKYQNRFRYVMVDEYQDTNRIQYLILSLLTQKKWGGHENICVVGDEDQSIYKWRGADIRNILEFEQDYPGAKVILLEQNYRSTQSIIRASSELIRNNRERKEKTLWTENSVGTPIQRILFSDEKGEAEFVVRNIKKLCESEGYALQDCAIIYRTHAQSRQFENILRREKLHYEIYGGLRFYDRREIKDVLSYLGLIINPLDSIALKRIINVPARGIGKTTIEKLDSSGVATGQSLWATLQQISDGSLVLDLGSATLKKLKAFYQMVAAWQQEWSQTPLTQLYYRILNDTGYILSLKEEGTDEALARVENLEEFDTVLQEFEEKILGPMVESEKPAKYPELLPQFLEESAIASEPQGDFEEPGMHSVQLMTLHASKGLEFPIVFMVGMEEGLFPSIQGWEADQDEEVEEERRLCYVGMTRAKKILYWTHCQVRHIWGQIKYQEPARFIQEVPDEWMQFQDARFELQSRAPMIASHPVSRPSFTKTRSPLIGKGFDHPDYGTGEIIDCEGDGGQSRLVVRFPRSGSRKFILKYVEQYIQ